MAFTNYFYNSLTKKYVTLFGTYFNKLTVKRYDETGATVQTIIVPISYGPYQKFLARITQDPKLDKKAAIVLPRMAFEITNISYDGPRKLTSSKRIQGNPDNEELQDFVYTGTPYNIEFNLYVMSKYSEDDVQIMEQILPFFQPEWTSSVKLMPNIDAFDIPLILNGNSMEDTYEGNFEERRAIIRTYSFTMKAWYFGPTRRKQLIKFIDVQFTNGMSSDIDPFEEINIQPGLTANGAPTSNIDETIPYTQINIGDDWGIITIFKDYEE